MLPEDDAMAFTRTSAYLKCADVRADLSALVDDAVDADCAVRLQQHLRGCRTCSAEWEQLVHLRKVLRVAVRVAPPPDLALALRVRLYLKA